MDNSKFFKEHDVFIKSKKEIEQHLTFIEDYLIKAKIARIDVLITVLLNLTSYSLTLFIAFLSIPSLNANYLYPLISFVLSGVVLVALILLREYQANKLISEFLNKKITFIRLLQEDEKLKKKIK